MPANGRKSIFITGAASGIGRATSMLFAQNGWFVGGYDRNTDGLKALEAEIGAANCVTERPRRHRQAGLRARAGGFRGPDRWPP